MGAASDSSPTVDEVAARLARFGIHPSPDELDTLTPLAAVARQNAAMLRSGMGLPPPQFPSGATAASPPAAPVESPAPSSSPSPSLPPPSLPPRPGPFGPLTTVVEVAAQLARGERSSADLVDELLERADRLDGELGAYLTRFDDDARAAARLADDERRAGRVRSALHGVPLALKDLIATREAPSSGHSRVPAWTDCFDAHVVTVLRDAGAIILGKTSLNEHATGPIDPSTGFPVPRNPWRTDRWPGGSSSGSAVGVAAGLFPVALGTDTGGSIRIPAAACGLAGFKPTVGSIDTTGIAPLSWSLDTVGPMALTAADCTVVHSVLTGGAGALPGGTARGLAGVRLGVDESWAAVSGVHPDVTAAFADAVAALESLGASVTRIDLSAHAVASTAGSVVQAVEVFEHHRDNLASRWTDYGARTRPFLTYGAFYDGADYVRAQRLRRAAAEQLQDEPVDFFVSPTIGVPAPLLDDDHAAFVPLFFTQLWNTVGFPAISVPMGASDGLPLGLQIAGRLGADLDVLRCGLEYELAQPAAP